MLEEDHPITIPSKFGSNWATDSRQDVFLCEFPIRFNVKLSSAMRPSWSEGGTTRHNLRCYWKHLWSRWAITGSWEPLVSLTIH
jgi:hypothetical protein